MKTEAVNRRWPPYKGRLRNRFQKGLRTILPCHFAVIVDHRALRGLWLPWRPVKVMFCKSGHPRVWATIHPAVRLNSTLRSRVTRAILGDDACHVIHNEEVLRKKRWKKKSDKKKKISKKGEEEDGDLNAFFRYREPLVWRLNQSFWV